VKSEIHTTHIIYYPIFAKTNSVKRLLLILFFLSNIFNVSSQKLWTLRECLEYASTNNIQVKQSELQVKIAKNNKLQSMLDFLPGASINSSYNFNFGNSIDPTTFSFINDNSQSLRLGLNTDLTLFNGLQKINALNRNKSESEAAIFDAQNALNNTALQITNFFLQALLNKELKVVSEKQIEISSEQLNRAKSQVKAGALAEATLYEFEAQLARDNANAIQAKYNELFSLIQLKLALQLPDETPFDISPPPTQEFYTSNISNTSPTSIYQTALYNQPFIKSAQARISSAIYSKKIAQGTFSPNISFSFNLSDNYFNKATRIVTISPLVREPISLKDQLDQNLTKVVGFNLTMPILTGWARMNNIANSKVQIQLRELDLESQKNRLRQDIQQAYNNVVSSFETLSANEKAANSSKKSFEAFQKRYGAGLANIFELQQSQVNLFRAQSQLLQSKYTFLLNQKILDFYEGKPITLD
jgi:outer membrane protein